MDYLTAGKVCTGCKIERPLSEYHKQTGTKDGRRHRCKFCFNEYLRRYKSANGGRARERTRAHYVRRKYGLTEGEYLALLESHNFKCAICGRPEKDCMYSRLYVDHEHTTGSIRGLLCNSCNSGIGYFFDSPELLQSAISYLKERSQ